MTVSEAKKRLQAARDLTGKNGVGVGQTGAAINELQNEILEHISKYGNTETRGLLAVFAEGNRHKP